MTNLNFYKKESLKLLSNRIKGLTYEEDNHSNYINQEIHFENISLNLSLIISHIILNLKFTDQSEFLFMKTIKEYNELNNTKITPNDFKALSWVRFLKKEVLIASKIRSYLFKLRNKSVSISKDKNDLVLCLQKYYEKSYKNKTNLIKEKNLKNILNKYSNKKINIDSLISKGIIEKGESDKIYHFRKNSSYAYQLRNEIGAILWELIIEEKSTILEFNKYFKILDKTQILVDNLKRYIRPKDILKICEFSYQYLRNENDLINNEDEFQKLFLDLHGSSTMDFEIDKEIPKLSFNYSSPIEFIDSVNHKLRMHNELLDSQVTRSFCYSLLRLIISSDIQHNNPYKTTIKIFSEIERSFLVWSLYSSIPTSTPQVIPYLLQNSKLIPLAFRQIEKIKISRDIFSDRKYLENNSNNEKDKVKYEIWKNMLDFIFERYESEIQEREEIAKAIAKVILDISKNIFIEEQSVYEKINYQNILIKKHKYIIEKINSIHNNSVDFHGNKKYIVLSKIFNLIKETDKNKVAGHTEYIRISSGLLYLSIELLKTLRMFLDLCKDIKNLLEELTLILKKYVVNYYISNLTEFQSYLSDKVIEKTPVRGVNEFGLEVIDWGYFILHMDREKYFDEIYRKFKLSIIFDTNGDIYTKENKEQYEKINIFLRSLLISHDSIINNDYAIYDFNEEIVINKLEKIIVNLSLKYSLDDINNSQIDVFINKISFNKNIHYENNMYLLCRSVNKFKYTDVNKFFRDFFKNSIDIGRMIAAINNLTSREPIKLISKTLNSIKVKDFINSVFTITELKSTLVDIINSDQHWELSQPFIRKIQNHLKITNNANYETNNLLFEINLLLAYKSKNLDELAETPIPKNPYNLTINGETKNLFIALFEMYHKNNYLISINILNGITGIINKSVRYNFHLYQAKTLLSIEEDDLSMQISANNDWDDFSENLERYEKKEVLILSQEVGQTHQIYPSVNTLRR